MHSLSISDTNKLIKDIAKDLTKIFIVHILTYTLNNSCEFMCDDFMKTTLYTMIGLIVYHLIIKKLILD